MRKIKNVVGALLILVSVGSLVFWESYGRNEFTTRKVLAAGETIAEGSLLKREMFSEVNVLPENVVEGVIGPEDFHKIEGQEAAQFIQKNQVMSESFARAPGKKISENHAPYVIKGHWIDSRSSSLRRGDVIRIFSRDGGVFLGEFEILFVKDADEKEVTDARVDDGLPYNPLDRRNSAIADRTNSNGVIDHLEILTSLREYQKILQFVEGAENADSAETAEGAESADSADSAENAGQTLLIVQKGEIE